MNFNKKQKKVLLSELLIISAIFLLWLISGGEVFTKTQVMIELQDELTGTPYKMWQERFVPGLDLVFGIFLFLSVLTLYILRRIKN